jgi:exonuclease V gamma subunit
VWIAHLALCATGSTPNITRLIGREEKKNVQFVPVSEATARALLLDLVELYQIGLCMPLPLLHAASEAFVQALHKGESEDAAYGRAQSELNKQSAPGMSVLDDAHVLQVWSREELQRLSTLVASDGERELSFKSLAERTLGPMLRATQKDD